jgi:glycosyltransferase involved in cell wall biosynthesis
MTTTFSATSPANSPSGFPSSNFPKVSLLVLTYNQRHLLDVSVASALAQDCPPIQIILSDDGSTDSSFERLKELAAAYKGPHSVSARCNAGNVGIGEHYNQLLNAASGELLITAAGDDVSTPDRVRKLVAAWEATGRRADLITSHVVDLDMQNQLHEVIRVDDLSLWPDLAAWMTKRPYIIGASHAYTRRMMEHFGPMLKGIAYEDQIMVFRAICRGGAVTVDEALVHYRRGGTSGRPKFETVEHMETWTARQTDRMVAEMEQLIADADVARCGGAMRAVMDKPMRRDRYLRVLQRRPSVAERWKAMLNAAPLAWDWRLRKLLHNLFPSATLHVKSVLQLFHRRYWRARREARTVGDQGKNSSL